MFSFSADQRCCPKTLHIVCIIFGFVIITITNAHPQFRKLVCLTKNKSFWHGNEVSRCHLVLKDTENEEPGRSVPEEAGCFSVPYNATSNRVYCDLFCPKAHTVFHSGFDLFHRSCFNYHNYQLEQKGENWRRDKNYSNSEYPLIMSFPLTTNLFPLTTKGIYGVRIVALMQPQLSILAANLIRHSERNIHMIGKLLQNCRQENSSKQKKASQMSQQ